MRISCCHLYCIYIYSQHRVLLEIEQNDVIRWSEFFFLMPFSHKRLFRLRRMTIWRRISNYLVQNGMNIETEKENWERERKKNTWSSLITIRMSRNNSESEWECFSNSRFYRLLCIVCIYTYINRILTKFTVMCVVFFFHPLYVRFFGFPLLRYLGYGWLCQNMNVCLLLYWKSVKLT